MSLVIFYHNLLIGISSSFHGIHVFNALTEYTTMKKYEKQWAKFIFQIYMIISTRTTRTPAFWGYPPPPHDYPYYWVILDAKSKEDKVKVTDLKNSPKFQIFEFWDRHYTRHIFWSCLIRCANMKWIRRVLLKIQSGHYSVHRRTDGQGETSIPPFQLCWSRGYNNLIALHNPMKSFHSFLLLSLSHHKLNLGYWVKLVIYFTQLEQLERLRSEDTPYRLMIAHIIESYWIPSQKKTKSKLQI